MIFFTSILLGMLICGSTHALKKVLVEENQWDWSGCPKNFIDITFCSAGSKKPCVGKPKGSYAISGINTLLLELPLVPSCNASCLNKFRFTVEDDKGSNYSVILPNKLKQEGNSSEPVKITEINITNFKNNGRFTLESNSCIVALFPIEIHYYTCDPENSELLKFPLRHAPGTIEPLKVFGTCVGNSVNGKTSPYMLCMKDGTSQVFGECVCKEGYEKVGGSCQECNSSSYKSQIGNQNCTLCGLHSNATNKKTQCACSSGFYRILNDNSNYSLPCYEPPSRPNVKHVTVTSNAAKIYWEIPNPGSNAYGVNIISCHNCPSSKTFKTFNTTNFQAKITGLDAFSEYTVSIVMVNNITRLTGKKFSVEYKIRTNTGALEQIRNVKTEKDSDGGVIITWTPPFNKGAEKIEYEIFYNGKTVKTESTSIKIQAASNSRTFKVKIKVIATYSDGKFTSAEHVFTVSVEGKGLPLNIVLGATGGVLVLVIIIIVLCIVWRRRNPSHLAIYRMEDGTVQLQRSRLFSHGRVYVDPTTYSLVDDAVYEFTNELTRKSLNIGDLLGCGEFADVHHAVLTTDNKKFDVAVKKLKYAASKRDRDDFVSEAAILGQFSHQNVIKLEGVILNEHPNLIVLEYMANGALDKYLQQNEDNFSVVTLLGMSRGIACGMAYLSDLGYIHRDLAARNVLVNKQDVCKIADFGMSRELKTDETYDTRGGKIPIKWTAPESIEFKKFTTASDVWSFGIVLWEIFSFGERPYWTWTNYDVLERLATGYRLPPPANCPKVVHDLMLQCWHREKTKRPKFITMRDNIEEWIRIPDLLKEIASVVTKSDENLDYSLMQNVTSWLEAIKMEQYAPVFINNGFTTPKDMLELTMEDLNDLCIGPIGHRKKILKAVKHTRHQVGGGKVSRSASNVTSKLGRSTSSVGFNAALSNKLSFYRKRTPSSSGTKNTLDRREKKTSFSCV